jgi:hypothetical protein
MVLTAILIGWFGAAALLGLALVKAAGRSMPQTEPATEFFVEGLSTSTISTGSSRLRSALLVTNAPVEDALATIVA